MEKLKSFIRNVPDFPHEGIQFKDVSTLFQSQEGFSMALDGLVEIYKDQKIDKIAGVESRGFILGAALADRLKVGFLMIRKKGKLPWKAVSQSYDLEYGTDELELHIDAVQEGEKVLVVDDLLATGGTLEAAGKLVEQLKGEVMGMTCVVELTGLPGREKLKDYDVTSLITYNIG